MHEQPYLDDQLWPAEPLFEPEEMGGSHIASHSQYMRSMRRLHEERTGGHNIFLSDEHEWQLATTIEESEAVRQQIALLREEDPARADTLATEHAELLAAGKDAQNLLIETHLRLAAYYARASMNILPKPKTKARSSQSAQAGSPLIEDDGDSDEDGFSPQVRPGAFTNISTLRSPYASLEDRIQVANMALVQAAAQYRPVFGKSGRRVSFYNHAHYRIHSALSHYVGRSEMPGWYVGETSVDALYAAQRQAAEQGTPLPDNLELRRAGRETVSIDDITPVGSLDDEKESDWYEPHLTLADVLPDFDGDEEHTYGFALSNLQLLIDSCLYTLRKQYATVLTMYYGLDGHEARSTMEIAEYLGVSRSRVGQIRDRAIEHLQLMDYKDRNAVRRIRWLYLEPSGQPDYESQQLPPLVEGIPLVRTDSAVVSGLRGVRHAMGVSNPPSFDRDGLTSRPLEPDDWDEPARQLPEQLLHNNEALGRTFARILANAPVDDFRRPLPGVVHTPYPLALLETLHEEMGASLTSGHVEAFWNKHIDRFTATLAERLGDDFDLDRVSTLFSRLLSERLGDDDTVELHIPERLQGRLNYFGTGLKHGIVVVRGNLGEMAGYNMGGLANMKVYGSVGDFAGLEMRRFASLTVMGDAGHFLGAQGKDEIHIYVSGSTGDNCGDSLNAKQGQVIVKGNAGYGVASNALDGTILVGGTAKSNAKPTNFKGTVSIGHNIPTLRNNF